MVNANFYEHFSCLNECPANYNISGEEEKQTLRRNLESMYYSQNNEYVHLQSNVAHAVLCVVQELIFRDSSSMCTGYCSNLVWSAC